VAAFPRNPRPPCCGICTPDIIIADYRLRGILQRRPGGCAYRQTFGLITGDTAPERIRDDHGFTLLHKPVEPAELRAAIAANLSQQATGDCQRRIVVAARTRPDLGE
jgi:hypothetical protein